jgi:cellulose biosynthesis protein BcsQ
MSPKRTRHTRRVSVRQRKGGSTKSNTILNLAVILALWGYNVWLGEFDDSPYLDRALRRDDMTAPLDVNRTAYRMFTSPEGILSSSWELPIEDMFSRVPSHSKRLVARVREEYGWQHPGTLMFLPGSESLNEIEHRLEHYADPIFELYRALGRNNFEGFDFIMMDSTPQLLYLNRNVAAASHEVVIPIPLTNMTTIGDYALTAQAVADDIAACRSKRVEGPHILGVLYQKYLATVRRKPSYASALYERYAHKHRDSAGNDLDPEIQAPEIGRIRLDRNELIIASEATRYPIPMYAPRCRMTQDWLVAAATFLTMLGEEPPPFQLPEPRTKMLDEPTDEDITAIVEVPVL